jgi:hypothetical protein
MSHTVAFGQLARTGIGTRVEADDDRLGGNGQVDVGLADTAHAGIDQLHLDLVGGQLEQRSCASASCEPCTSALMMMGSVLTSPAVMSVNMFSSLAACCLASLVLRNLPAR